MNYISAVLSMGPKKMAIKAALPCAAAAAALIYCFTANSQTPAPTPAPQAETTPAPAGPAPERAAPAAQPAKPKPTKPNAMRAEDKARSAVASPLPPAETTAAQAECAWVGKRVVSLLVRDDVDTATDFTRFYAMFHCPQAHIAATLACVVSDPGAAREGAALTEHVELCWANPTTRLLPQKPPNPDRPAPTKQ